MRCVSLILFFLWLKSSLFAQVEITRGVTSFLKDYEAVLNNLSDTEQSLQSRKLFREDILDVYFSREETKVYNHLSEQGSRFLKGEEYLENLLVDYNERLQHELLIEEDMEFDFRSSTFIIPVTHIVRMKGKEESQHLRYVVKYYNDSRPDIISILGGKEITAKIEEEKAYQRAKEANTIAAFKSFLTKYPDGEYAEEAGATLQQLQEKSTWAVANESDAVKDYESYLSQYPNGKYAAEAKKRILKLEADARYERLPTPVKDLVDQMIYVDGGRYTMGCTSEQKDCFNDEKVINKVEVESFKIGAYEVTQEQWISIMGNNPSYFTDCMQCPVEQVSWVDVQQFLKKLNQMTGNDYRLPTEEEWEYAARGGTESKEYLYAGSNALSEVGLFSGNSAYELSESRFKPNALGIYHMSGGVFEWCQDTYTDLPSNRQELKVIRGGAWNSADRYCRVSHRQWMKKGDEMDNVGFRIARN